MPHSENHIVSRIPPRPAGNDESRILAREVDKFLLNGGADAAPGVCGAVWQQPCRMDAVGSWTGQGLPGIVSHVVNYSRRSHGVIYRTVNRTPAFFVSSRRRLPTWLTNLITDRRLGNGQLITSSFIHACLAWLMLTVTPVFYSSSTVFMFLFFPSLS